MPDAVDANRGQDVLTGVHLVLSKEVLVLMDVGLDLLVRERHGVVDRAFALENALEHVGVEDRKWNDRPVGAGCTIHIETPKKTLAE